MKTAAVILARGGSKGIHNKNIINLNGFPLIYYTIEAGLLSDVNEVWVSTDSEKIAEIAQQYEAKVLIRPNEFATDTASSELALIHFCENVEAETIVFIQPTSPLLFSLDINYGLRMHQKGYDSVFSGYREHWLPRWSDSNEDGVLKEINWQKNKRPRRQDIENLIVENGAFYISKRENILKNKNRYSGKIGFYEMPYSRSFQVDNYDDLFIIESILKNKKY